LRKILWDFSQRREKREKIRESVKNASAPLAFFLDFTGVF